MKKVLLVNGHPNYRGEAHATNELLKFTESQLSEFDVKVLNVYDEKENVLAITEETFELWGTNPEEFTSRQKDLVSYRMKLIEEFMEADVVFIYDPLHNFGITSKLKDYFDNILLVHKTFKYTANGSVGLLDNSKRVIFVQASGSDYSRDIRYIHADLAPMHVRSLLGFMGITEMDLVRAQGLSIVGADTKKIIEDAKTEIKNLITTL